jgi:hypothetical protein
MIFRITLWTGRNQPTKKLSTRLVFLRFCWGKRGADVSYYVIDLPAVGQQDLPANAPGIDKGAGTRRREERQ